MLFRSAATFEATHSEMLARKLGVGTLDVTADAAWLDELYELLAASEADLPVFFRALSGRLASAPESFESLLQVACAALPSAALLQRWHAWFDAHQTRVRRGDAGDRAARRRAMDLDNPLYLPRNYLTYQAIEALEQGDAALLERLLELSRHPYRVAPAAEVFAARRPAWARDKAGC